MNAYQNKLTLSPARERVIICIILGIFPLLGMAVDLIAPSLPAISQHLHISETVSKNLIAIYLLGYALGHWAGANWLYRDLLYLSQPVYYRQCFQGK
jgi:fucose permease